MAHVVDMVPSSPVLLAPEGLEAIVDALIGSGRDVIAPVVLDGVISLGAITSADDLPIGWADDQGPGTYRIEHSADHTRFRFAAPAQSWKRFLHEERTLLVRTRLVDGEIEIENRGDDQRKLAFVGIRACDLAAIQRLDVVLAADAAYQQRRAGLAMIAVACTTAASTCFCASMGTGPDPGPGADLVLAELDDGMLLAAANTDLGCRLLRASGALEAASPERVAEANALTEACAASQVRALDPDVVTQAAAHPHGEEWTKFAERCLSCGNCTMVCPTCFCTSVEDRTSITDDAAERWQRWDSCFSLDFSYIHGGSIRQSPASRYRQWYLHKLSTWHDQFGSSGCVGCGRCITWCPTGIDLTKAVMS